MNLTQKKKKQQHLTRVPSLASSPSVCYPTQPLLASSNARAEHASIPTGMLSSCNNALPDGCLLYSVSDPQGVCLLPYSPEAVE